MKTEKLWDNYMVHEALQLSSPAGKHNTLINALSRESRKSAVNRLRSLWGFMPKALRS